MAKRKKQTKTKNNSKLLSYIAWSLGVIAISLSATLIGYYVGYDNAKEESTNYIKIQESKHIKELQKQKEDINKRLQKVLQKEREKNLPQNYTSAAHEIDDETLAHAPKIKKHLKKRTDKRPKLAIIIDDVSTRSQVKAIKSLHLPLTMSFFPPTPRHPNTAKLAAKEQFYMVHLPMGALHWKAEEPQTLHIHDSQQVISARIDEIRRLFSDVHFINNHTGSKFTSNEKAMTRLITALKQHHISFIDSRTTAKTKAPIVLKHFGMKYIARDVFLDHHTDKPYVLKQIKEAIRVAKSNGEAIAIGHPHKNTLQALYESKKLLKAVDLILVYQIK